MSRKLSIVCLHGYTSNSFILARRMGAIRKACKNVADFHFINGPLLVQPITATQSLDAPEKNEEVTEDTPIEEQPRAWWKSSDEGSYKEADKTWKALSEEFAKIGKIDGVLGFSQGGCLAFLLAAIFENPNLFPALKLPEDQGPLKFCVAISGFRSRDPDHQPVFEARKEGVKTPVLSILGRNDQIVDEERSRTIIDIAQNSREEWHQGGHVVPSQAPWRNFLRDFFATFISDTQPNEDWRTVDGPAARVGHAEEDEPGSGAATPAGPPKRSGL